MLLGLYFFLMIALPLALGAVVVFNGLSRGRLCPACAAETLRLRSAPADFASRMLRDEALHRRWCHRCEWTGFSRIRRLRPARTHTAPRPRTTGADSVGVRSISMDGETWQILLQCWAEHGQWRGRLLFVDPAGHAWPEPSPALEGASPLAVLSQVLSLPEGSLAGRIRQAIR